MLMSAALCHAAGVGQWMVGSIFAFVVAAAEPQRVDAELKEELTYAAAWDWNAVYAVWGWICCDGVAFDVETL